MEEMDSHRRKSFALLSRKGADGRAELDDGEPAPSIRASRSFSKVVDFLLPFCKLHMEFVFHGICSHS